jgi:predicted nucleotidyltransferase
MTPTTKNEADKLIRTMVERIVGRFKPEKVILFGSHARGQGSADSDADLLVVMNINGSKRQQAVQIDLALAGIPLPADILVATPEDLEHYRDCIGSIIREALLEGQVLYDRAA